MSASPEVIELPSFPVRDSPVSPPTTPTSSEADAVTDESAEYARCRTALEGHIPTKCLSVLEAIVWMLNFRSLWVRNLSCLL